VVAGLMLVAGLAGFACGGDDDAATDDADDTEQVATGRELSVEEFRAEGNALCLAYRGRTEELAQEAARKEGSGMSPTVREMREYVSQTLPEFRLLLRQLKALRAPAAEAGTYADVIEAGERAITEAEVIKEDNQRLLSREYGDAFALFNRGAHALGLEACIAE
jgi:hypothetical protein